MLAQFAADHAPNAAEIEAALEEVKGAPPTKLLEPSPLAAPEVAALEVAATETVMAPVEFEPNGGEHRSSVTFVLRCATPNAQIRFALDAEDVDENSSLYHEPQLLTQSTVVAARAWVDGQSGPLCTCRFEVQKALWQQREPEDRSDEVAHEISDQSTLIGDWKLAAASARGKLHAHRGAWREDSYAFGTAGAWTIIAVADGAGSAALSRVGSRVACEASLACLRMSLDNWKLTASDEDELKSGGDLKHLRDVLVEAARHALLAIGGQAQERGRSVAEFATTLLLLICTEWNGQTLCAALQVGDGAIALWDDQSTLTPLGVADHGAHSSETRFLTTTGIEDELPGRVLFSIKPDLRALTVLTDGISDDFFPEAQRLSVFFEQVLPRLRSAEDAGAALLDWLGYEKKGSSDDRTAVVVWR